MMKSVFFTLLLYFLKFYINDALYVVESPKRFQNISFYCYKFVEYGKQDFDLHDLELIPINTKDVLCQLKEGMLQGKDMSYFKNKAILTPIEGYDTNKEYCSLSKVFKNFEEEHCALASLGLAAIVGVSAQIHGGYRVTEYSSGLLCPDINRNISRVICNNPMKLNGYHDSVYYNTTLTKLYLDQLYTSNSTTFKIGLFPDHNSFLVMYNSFVYFLLYRIILPILYLYNFVIAIKYLREHVLCVFENEKKFTLSKFFGMFQSKHGTLVLLIEIPVNFIFVVGLVWDGW